MEEKEFKQGLGLGIVLMTTLAVLTYMMVSATQATPTEGWHVDANYYGAYSEGLKTVPHMQEQDSIDTAVLELQEKYNLSDEDTEKLYLSLVD